MREPNPTRETKTSGTDGGRNSSIQTCVKQNDKQKGKYCKEAQAQEPSGRARSTTKSELQT